MAYYSKLSDYTPYTGLYLQSGTYVDTEIAPTSEQSIEMLFMGQSVNGYIFGARNTNSNASAGQVNFFSNYNANGTGALNYFGYASTRISVSDTNTGDNKTFIRYGKVKNELQIMKDKLILNTIGATTEFEGTQTMYVGALNNAGTPLYRTAGALYFLGGSIEKQLMTPVFYSNYEDENSNITPTSGISIGGGFKPLANTSGSIGSPVYIEMGDSVGGRGLIKLYTGEKAEKVFCFRDALLRPHLVAEPDEGYVFKNWTDSYGNVVSTEADVWYEPYSGRESDIITANFEKKTAIEAGVGFRTLAIKYGTSFPPTFEDDLYANILSAKVTIDVTQKTTTTIELDEVPSTYQINMPLVILNPKGKVIYEGVIKAIENNTLTCRETLSIFDFDFLFHTNTNTFAKTTLENAMYQIMSLGAEYSTDDTSAGSTLLNLSRRLYNAFTFSFTHHSRVGQINVLNPTVPLITAANIENLEDYLFDIFINSGVYAKAELKGYSTTYQGEVYYYHRINLKPESMEDLDELVISDNDENMSNISISEDSENNTLLIVFNAAGTSVRGVYVVETDGTITPRGLTNGFYEVFNFDVAYTNYNPKIIMSNDDLYGIVKENLSGGEYNHEITFRKNYLNGCDFDKVKILQPVSFHYKDKVYKTVVTGWKYEISSGSEKITRVDYVLGKVRTSLTAKINIKRRR